MTPTEIAAQITSLYTQLAPLIADNDTDWDGDYAALLSELAKGTQAASDVLTAVAGKEFESDLWEQVRVWAEEKATDLANVVPGLEIAADIAESHQDEVSKAIEAAHAEAAAKPAVPAFYRADLERFDSLFRKAGALATTDDGFTYIDDAKVDARTLSAFRRLREYGAANGLPLALPEFDNA